MEAGAYCRCDVTHRHCVPCLRWRPMAANSSFCHRNPNPTSGAVRAVALSCASHNALPLLNSTWQASIPHDHVRQPARPACSMHPRAQVLFTAGQDSSKPPRPPSLNPLSEYASPSWSMVVIAIASKKGPQIHFLTLHTPFNIHNHRDRGKRLRLLSRLQIENASPIKMNSALHRDLIDSDQGANSTKVECT